MRNFLEEVMGVQLFKTLNNESSPYRELKQAEGKRVNWRGVLDVVLW